MAIRITQGFKVTSNEAIDANLTLTKSEMKNIDESLIPDKYLTVCQEDGKIYLYNKDNTVDETTGKFRLQESGGGSVPDNVVLANENSALNQYSMDGDLGADKNIQLSINATTNNATLRVYDTSSQDDVVSKDLQEQLVSGENIKTINNMSILGNGNIDVSGGAVPENIMTARAVTGAGNVDIYSITGSSDEYTPVDDKVTMDLRVIQGGTYDDLPQFNILTAGAGTSLYSKHLATKDYVDSKEPDAITNQDIDTIIFG